MENFDVVVFIKENIFVDAVVLAMLVLVFEHYLRKVDRRSVIVSLGVLGTFTGIVIGLFEFDTQQIAKSIPPLLEGLKTAFVTSIAGMALSILLSIFQKSSEANEMALLGSINDKLDDLQSLPKIEEQIKDFRTELRDAQSGLRNFLEESFTKTNQSLEQAIETLSKGATEEIIKSLEDVVTDFNTNLTEQFGDNFKQLNEAVFKLVEWQEQYKSSIESGTQHLERITESLESSQETLAEIAKRNAETQEVYSGLKAIIETFDTQIKTLNEQLQVYSALGNKVETTFKTIEEGFDSIVAKHNTVVDKTSEFADTIETTLNSQSDLLSALGDSVKTTFEKFEKGIESIVDKHDTVSESLNQLTQKLPESLEALEKTLVGLTEKFSTDYQTFLDKVKELNDVINEINNNAN